MRSNILEKTSVSLSKSVFYLFLLQCLFGQIAVSIFSLMEYLWQIPILAPSKGAIYIAGLAGSGIYYGDWFEYKYPGVLDGAKIKKISLRISLICTIINTIVIALLFSLDEHHFDCYWEYIVFFMVPIVIIFLSAYWIVKRSLKRGVDLAEKKRRTGKKPRQLAKEISVMILGIIFTLFLTNQGVMEFLASWW